VQNFRALAHESTAQYGTKHVRKVTAIQKISLIPPFPSNHGILARQREYGILGFWVGCYECNFFGFFETF
jgi:hypothetical protein